ncbi:MAG: prolyl oligopeptidase family serine peptidase [Phycisphaerae bacterium]
MKRTIFAVILGVSGLVWAADAPLAGKLAYPAAQRGDQVDDYHGTKVADPYRWLEDLDSAQTKAWVDAENKITFGFLGKIPQREKIRQRLTKLWNFERFGLPFKEGGHYFWSRNTGLQNQSVYYTADALDGSPRELLDPNTLAADGTVALAGLAVSEDGKHVAYGLAAAGSDWNEWKVRDVATGKDTPDVLKWIKFSGASWKKDGSGFFYSRYDEPKGKKMEDANYFQKLYFHKLGAPQSDDALVYHRPDQKEWGFGGAVTEDGRYLIISITKGTERKNLIYFQDLAAADGKTVELLTEWEAEYDFIGNDGPVFWFRTDLDAPRGRVVAIDTRKPGKASWHELIPQSKDTLQGVNLVNDTFIADYLSDAHSKVSMFDLSGKHVRDVALPGIGTAAGFGGKRRDTETFYSYTSFATPTTIYRYDMKTGQSTVFKQPKVDFNPDDYEVKQVFYSSKDGTQVPMFLCHKKGLKLDGKNPTFLYGYGGFNISLTPTFNVTNIVWMEMGGVYAMPNLRGGGEYGKEWHENGRLHKKQNVFDDFIAAGEWLIGNKYTNNRKLAIAGGSNGGLLVGACETQRPDLYAACIPMVGVMDMLRFNKFTIGWAWTADYGSSDDPAYFKTLYKYSPLHNIKSGTHYPPTLVITADHDDRVVPSHSFKYAATLQAAQAGDAPILIRIETRAGHGAGKPTSKIIEEHTDRWSFLVHELGMDGSGLKL